MSSLEKDLRWHVLAPIRTVIPVKVSIKAGSWVVAETASNHNGQIPGVRVAQIAAFMQESRHV
jgi:hypothetical protein